MANINYTYYGDNVRVFTERDPHRGEDMEVVQRWAGTQWRVERKFGHMSDDYALTNARQCAQSLARTHIGGH